MKRGVTVYVHKRLLRQQAHLLIVLCSWGQELVEGGVLLRVRPLRAERAIERAMLQAPSGQPHRLTSVQLI